MVEDWTYLGRWGQREIQYASFLKTVYGKILKHCACRWRPFWWPTCGIRGMRGSKGRAILSKRGSKGYYAIVALYSTRYRQLQVIVPKLKASGLIRRLRHVVPRGHPCSYWVLHSPPQCLYILCCCTHEGSGTMDMASRASRKPSGSNRSHKY